MHKPNLTNLNLTEPHSQVSHPDLVGSMADIKFSQNIQDLRLKTFRNLKILSKRKDFCNVSRCAG